MAQLVRAAREMEILPSDARRRIPLGGVRLAAGLAVAVPQITVYCRSFIGDGTAMAASQDRHELSCLLCFGHGLAQARLFQKRQNARIEEGKFREIINEGQKRPVNARG